MALPLLNNAEASVSGTAITAVNVATVTGGTDANAFDAAVIGTNAGLAFDNLHAAHGTRAFKLTQTGTTIGITYLEWSTAWTTAVQHIFGAVYVYLTATPSSSLRFIQFFNGTTLIGGIAITSGSPTVAFRSAADAQIGTATTALTLNTFMRIEYDILFGASGVATGTIKAFTGDGTTPLAIQGALGANAFGTSAGANKIRFGANTANWMTVAGPTSMWIDDINVNSTALPGPGPYTAGGGAALTQTINDTLALADALSTAQGKGLAETVALTDATTFGIGNTQSDTLALADATSFSVGKSLSDTLALADALSISTGLSLSEALTLADAISLGLGLSLSDSITLADFADPLISAGGGNLTQNIDDLLALSDSTSLGLSTVLSDSVALSDTLSKAIGASLSDSVTLIDATSLDIGLSLSEALTLADSATTESGYVVVISDSLPLDDSQAFDYGKTLVEVMPLSDAVHLFLNGVEILPTPSGGRVRVIIVGRY